MKYATDDQDNWHFDRVTINGGLITTDPNTWTVTRANGLCIITDSDGALIDEPTDTGQSDLDLIICGIGWLHADSLEN